MPDEFLSTKEVAKMLGMSEAWVLLNKQHFMYMTLSYNAKRGSFKYYKSSVLAFIEKRTTKPENPIMRRFK